MQVPESDIESYFVPDLSSPITELGKGATLADVIAKVNLLIKIQNQALLDLVGKYEQISPDEDEV